MNILPINIIYLDKENYHLMVEISFENGQKGNMVIDTGASKTVFDENSTSCFLTEIENVDTDDSVGINGRIAEAKIGKIAEINFGNLKIIDYQCVLIDLSHINEVYEKLEKPIIIGLIGSDFLMKHQAIINYKKETLTLYKPKKIKKC